MKTNSTTRRIRYERECSRLMERYCSWARENHIPFQMDTAVEDAFSRHSEAARLAGVSELLNTPVGYGFSLMVAAPVAGSLLGAIAGAGTGYALSDSHPIASSLGGGLAGLIAGGIIAPLVLLSHTFITSSIDKYKIKKHDENKVIRAALNQIQGEK